LPPQAAECDGEMKRALNLVESKRIDTLGTARPETWEFGTMPRSEHDLRLFLPPWDLAGSQLARLIQMVPFSSEPSWSCPRPRNRRQHLGADLHIGVLAAVEPLVEPLAEGRQAPRAKATASAGSQLGVKSGLTGELGTFRGLDDRSAGALARC
jgi:hypothetical protein